MGPRIGVNFTLDLSLSTSFVCLFLQTLKDFIHSGGGGPRSLLSYLAVYILYVGMVRDRHPSRSVNVYKEFNWSFCFDLIIMSLLQIFNLFQECKENKRQRGLKKRFQAFVSKKWQRLRKFLRL
jgi:hypothetical protein